MAQARLCQLPAGAPLSSWLVERLFPNLTPACICEFLAQTLTRAFINKPSLWNVSLNVLRTSTSIKIPLVEAAVGLRGISIGSWKDVAHSWLLWLLLAAPRCAPGCSWSLAACSKLLLDALAVLGLVSRIAVQDCSLGWLLLWIALRLFS